MNFLKDPFKFTFYYLLKHNSDFNLYFFYFKGIYSYAKIKGYHF